MKASPTCWIDQNWEAMEILFKNCSAYISHLVQLSFTDSQDFKGKNWGISETMETNLLQYKYCNIFQRFKSY